MKTTTLIVAAALIAGYPSSPPPVGWSTDCKVTEIVDGDTITVEITRTVRVRLLDCWAPERTSAEGIKSKDHLTEIALGMPGVLFIPAGKKRLGDVWSFDRALGKVWLRSERKDLSTLMIEAGHATELKP